MARSAIVDGRSDHELMLEMRQFKSGTKAQLAYHLINVNEMRIIREFMITNPYVAAASVLATDLCFAGGLSLKMGGDEEVSLPQSKKRAAPESETAWGPSVDVQRDLDSFWPSFLRNAYRSIMMFGFAVIRRAMPGEKPCVLDATDLRIMIRVLRGHVWYRMFDPGREDPLTDREIFVFETDPPKRDGSLTSRYRTLLSSLALYNVQLKTTLVCWKRGAMPTIALESKTVDSKLDEYVADMGAMGDRSNLSDRTAQQLVEARLMEKESSVLHMSNEIAITAERLTGVPDDLQPSDAQDNHLLPLPPNTKVSSVIQPSAAPDIDKYSTHLARQVALIHGIPITLVDPTLQRNMENPLSEQAMHATFRALMGDLHAIAETCLRDQYAMDAYNRMVADVDPRQLAAAPAETIEREAPKYRIRVGFRGTVNPSTMQIINGLGILDHKGACTMFSSYSGVELSALAPKRIDPATGIESTRIYEDAQRLEQEKLEVTREAAKEKAKNAFGGGK